MWCSIWLRECACSQINRVLVSYWELCGLWNHSHVFIYKEQQNCDVTIWLYFFKILLNKWRIKIRSHKQPPSQKLKLYWYAKFSSFLVHKNNFIIIIQKCLSLSNWQIYQNTSKARMRQASFFTIYQSVLNTVSLDENKFPKQHWMTKEITPHISVLILKNWDGLVNPN